MTHYDYPGPWPKPIPIVGPTRAGKTHWIYISRKSEDMYLTHPPDRHQDSCTISGVHHINECGFRYKGIHPHEIRDKAPATFRDLDRLTQRVQQLESYKDEMMEMRAQLTHVQRAIIHLERVNSAMKRIFKGGK